MLKLFNITFQHNIQSIEQFRGNFPDPYVLLVTWGERVIGMCAIGMEAENNKSCYVYNLAVNKEQRRMNIGKGLFNQLKVLFPGQQFRWETHFENYNAILFFSKIRDATPGEQKDDYIEYTMNT